MKNQKELQIPKKKVKLNYAKLKIAKIKQISGVVGAKKLGIALRNVRKLTGKNISKIASRSYNHTSKPHNCQELQEQKKMIT